VDDIYARVVKMAEAAAAMTETSYEIEFLTGCAEYIRVNALAQVFDKALRDAGPPRFTDEEKAYARELAKSFPKGSRDEVPASVKAADLHEEIIEPLTRHGHGSSDVGDVSYVTPTVEISTACNVIGTPGHSWQYTATTGMSIGHKGMVCAARAMALGALRLFSEPRLVESARGEWEEIIRQNPYNNPIPKEQMPRLDVVKSHH
jgi:aminobenzoyl-glutamate utilization protein B